MEFGLSEEQVALRALVREFAREEIAPVIGTIYEEKRFPYDIISGLGRLGIFALPFPDKVGGQGGEHGDYLAFCLALEEIARVDSSVAITIEASVGLAAMPLYRFGSEEQKARYLAPLMAGEALGGFGLTEPGCGSDAGGTLTRARLEGGEWVIDGTKAFITNSGTTITRFVTVTAVTGARQDGKKEISTILVPAGTPGFTVGPEYSKVGWLASDTHELAFSECRVPEENLVGERGRGYAQFLEMLDEGRVAISAVATGLAQGCLDESLRYAHQREAFGSPIGAYQAIAFQLADMDARAHTSRLAYYDAARRLVAGVPFKRQAAIAKLHSSDAAVENARAATGIHGGYGFMNETPVARAWRDCKVLEIGEGTNEVQRMVIARELGLP